MAKLKLADKLELLKQHLGVESLDDLEEIEQLKGLTGEKQKLTETLQAKDQSIAQLNGMLQGLQQAKAQAGAQLERAERQIPDDDPFKDELLAPLRTTFDRLSQTVTTITQAFKAHFDDYSQFKKMAMDFANDVTVERLQTKYKDFDRKKIEAYAKEKNKAGVGWEDLYHEMRGQNVDALLEATRKEAREEALKEAGKKLAAPQTELGDGPAAPTVPEGKKDYEKGWGGLAAEFEQLGLD